MSPLKEEWYVFADFAWHGHLAAMGDEEENVKDHIGKIFFPSFLL